MSLRRAAKPRFWTFVQMYHMYLVTTGKYTFYFAVIDINPESDTTLTLDSETR